MEMFKPKLVTKMDMVPKKTSYWAFFL